jgi:hypothetical protein
MDKVKKTFEDKQTAGPSHNVTYSYMLFKIRPSKLALW